jgi:hypothetical protein
MRVDDVAGRARSGIKLLSTGLAFQQNMDLNHGLDFLYTTLLLLLWMSFVRIFFPERLPPRPMLSEGLTVTTNEWTGI